MAAMAALLLAFGVLLGLSHPATAAAMPTTADGKPAVFNVLDFGAVGDGSVDDAQAFLKAWTAACGSSAANPTVLVPPTRTFLLYPVTFKGPCKSPGIGFQISGGMVASKDLGVWQGRDVSKWLVFDGVDDLSVVGDGTIDGRGSNWWNNSCKRRPSTKDYDIIFSNLNWLVSTGMLDGSANFSIQVLTFNLCNDLRVQDLKITNSPMFHVVFLRCRRVHASGLTVDSPATSPNTDGLHVHDSTDIFVDTSTFHSGDDCISIGDKAFNINISNVFCGPGHGISVGSLGKEGDDASVEEIHVQDVYFVGTSNGARIKTWQGGKGYAKSITFERINLTDVDNPIIIDQYYCDSPTRCAPQPSAVNISDVKYKNFQGTSSTPVAISLNCSNAVGCSSLLFDGINLEPSSPGGELSSSCINAHGSVAGVVEPQIPCLKG